ncbi:MAG TPA: PKD domain-containing protein [Chitinophagaceae bacterium]
MKKILTCGIPLLLAAALLFFACKKEYSCENCRPALKPPIAKAGADQVILLPADSVRLDGSNSSDPDGKITEWQWKHISGPDSFNIINSKLARTTVRNLDTGLYQFELVVIDNDALTSRDTVQVSVFDPSQPNQPPVANAGADQVIVLPSNSVTLDGSGSTDADNNIISYTWATISGPSAVNLSNAVQTQATGLIQGVYVFVLTVTDGGGLADTDTVRITVSPTQTVPPVCNNLNRPTITAQLIPVGTLSQARAWISVVSSGNKLFFAGGSYGAPQGSSRVDIYDVITNSWSSAELCTGRQFIGTVAAGNKVFFAGGETGDGTWPVDSVDIYDVADNTWTVSHLSAPGNNIAAAAVGNKVVFAGGDGGIVSWARHTRVDILDMVSNTWSTATLSEEKRGGHVAITAGNKIYFAGGETMIVHGSNTWENNWAASNVLDIYDPSNNSWSTGTMAEGKLGFGGTRVDDKMIFAGGRSGSFPSVNLSCNVEIKNLSTGVSTVSQLFDAADWWVYGGQNIVVKNNKVIFCRANASTRDKFDIYDIGTNSWSIGVLPMSLPASASIIAVNNTIYVAGGIVNGSFTNQVWKLEF